MPSKLLKTATLGPVTFEYLDSKNSRVAAAALRAVAFCGGPQEFEDLCRPRLRRKRIPNSAAHSASWPVALAGKTA